jgi:Zn-dependent protease
MATTEQRAAAGVCPDCGTALSPSALSCPKCLRLTRSAELETLAQQARQAEAGGDLARARSVWAESLKLLPADTMQYRTIHGRIEDLDKQIKAAASARPGWKKTAAGAGPAAALAWKFKAIALVVLTKGKLILLGLTKLSTILTMLASFGLYWGLYGWPFALGLVLSIYIHEMGHVLALRRFGIPAGAPVFIPGFGAFIQMRKFNITPIQDSRVGLAGPIYGFGAALFAFAVASTTGSKLWFAIAHFGAVINLFNLIPVWQLDGSRGMHSLSKQQRYLVVGTAAACWAITSGTMLLFIALAGVFKLFSKDAPEIPDNTGLLQYCGLLIALSALMFYSPLR